MLHGELKCSVSSLIKPIHNFHVATKFVSGKYPEIKALMKPRGDPLMIFFGIILVIVQYSLAYINYYYISCLPLRFLLNCTLGTWIASAIFMHMHEAGHGTICGPNHLWKNRAYGSLMNFGLGLPLYAYFKKHHKVHHKYQGEVHLDVEYPYEFEPKYFTGPFGKYCWMVLNPEIQAIRSCMDKWSLNYFITGISIEEKLGLVSVITFNVWMAFSGRFYIMSHLILSTLAAMGGHVLGFWNIAVHVEFFPMQETSTYRGWLNFFMSNFGLHMEHHDFPNIPSRLLPKVTKSLYS